MYSVETVWHIVTVDGFQIQVEILFTGKSLIRLLSRFQDIKSIDEID